ncbi:MAG: hypothetical protein ACKO9F_04735, partial [Caldilinea sp.]
FDKPYRRHRVLLPTYPFQHQRYWPEATEIQTNGTENDEFAHWLAVHPLAQLTDRIAERLSNQLKTAETHTTILHVHTALADERRAQEQQSRLQSMLYEVIWERQRRLPTPAVPPAAGNWLILGNPDDVGQAVAAQLAMFGETSTLVQREAELATVLEQLVASAEQRPPLRGVLHLWALEKCEQGAATVPLAAAVADLMRRQERLLGSVLRVVQTLAAKGARARLWVVTQGAQQLTATEAVAVDQTPLWGMGRVIALEHGELWGGILDLESTRAAAEQAPTLSAELLQLFSTGEEQIAYRQGERYVARLAAANLTTTAHTPVIHSEGSYLITGGLGSLGLQTAQ